MGTVGVEQMTENTEEIHSPTKTNLGSSEISRKVKSDWKEFKLISFNVRSLNQESKQKIVYDLLKHNRP